MAKYQVRFKLSSGSYDVLVDGGTKLSEHFTFQEAWNNSSKDVVKLIVTDRFSTFNAMIEEFRIWINQPMKVNSWYRTNSFNKSVGGDVHSAHLIGTALDWGIHGHTAKQRENVTKKWKAICEKYKVIGAINYYTNGYHLEAYSDVCYGAKIFSVRDYRGKKGDW